MAEVESFLQTYYIEVIIGMVVMLFILLIINLTSLVKINKMKKNYTKLLNGRQGINLEELLTETGKEINDLTMELNAFKKKTDSIETKLAFAIQKVGFVRYNAFAEMGSDLSFSFALLDNFENGLVVTSIYGRDHASVYGKPIKGGKSVYPLSVEEIQAIDRAKIGQVGEKTIYREE